MNRSILMSAIVLLFLAGWSPAEPLRWAVLGDTGSKLVSDTGESGKDRTDTMSRPGHPSYTSTPNGSVLRVGIGAGQRAERSESARLEINRKEIEPHVHPDK